MDETFVPLLALGTLVKKLIDFLAYVTNGYYRKALSQVVVWVAGVVVVALYAQTDWAEGIIFAGRTLADMNFATQVAVGLGIGSAASVGTDLLKSVDNNDTQRTPSLIPGPGPANPPPGA